MNMDEKLKNSSISVSLDCHEEVLVDVYIAGVVATHLKPQMKRLSMRMSCLDCHVEVSVDVSPVGVVATRHNAADEERADSYVKPPHPHRHFIHRSN